MRVLALSLMVVLVIAGAVTVFIFRHEPASVTRSVPSTSAVSVKWFTDYQQALNRATETHKPILADFSGSDWCVTCIALKKEVFDTPEFSTWASQHVILLNVDFPTDSPQPEALKQQNLKLATTFVVDQFPMILFFDATGKKLGQLGYVAGDGPQKWIAAAEKNMGR